MGASRRSGSGRSRASSVQINQITYPRPLHARAGENYLTCEWCFESRPKRFFEGPDWRRHVDRDLKPYVCIAEDCTDPLPSFTNFRDWHGHMLAKHGRHWHREVHLPLFWTCPFCPGVSAAFDDPEETTTHIRDFHKLALGDAEVRTIAGQSRIQMRRKHGECPICCLSICTESPEESAGKRKQQQESAHPSYQHTMTGSDSAQTAQGTQAIGVKMESGVAEHDTLERETRISVEAVARHIASHLQALTFLTTRIISIHNHDGTDNISQGSSGDTSIQPSCNSRRSVDEDSRQAEGCDDDEEVWGLEPPLDVDETGPSIVWDYVSLSNDLPTEEEDYILQHLQKQQNLVTRDIPSTLKPPISPTPETETLIKGDLLGPKFRAHVSFDTTSQDINKDSGITLSARHDNFREQCHSKTVLVSIREDKYSEAALEWLLTDMVDDHDTVVCVRVVEKVVKPDENIKEQAYQLLRRIIKKNTLEKVLCMILEYQFGQLFPTFDTMDSVHQPSVIVTGTRGRSNRGVFSVIDSLPEYCLKELSAPVVVVRPQDVRLKKKDKRAGKPSWRTYKHILSKTNGMHESDVIDDEALSSSATQLSPANETREVAKAICLPDETDVATNAFDRETSPRQVDRLAFQMLSLIPRYAHWTAPLFNATITGGNNDDNASEDYGDDDNKDAEEANTMSASVLKKVKKEKLHEMEVREAAALKKGKSEDLLDI